MANVNYNDRIALYAKTRWPRMRERGIKAA